jgi:hypothetical protein
MESTMFRQTKNVDAALLAAVRRNFAAHGEGVLDNLRKAKPHAYFRLVALLLADAPNPPSPFEGVSDDELAAILAAARARLAAEGSL